MIKAIDYKKVEMSDEEFAYYQDLCKRFHINPGEDYFRDLFETNDEGMLTIIHPKKPVPMEIVYFMLNLQQNQWLRSYDARIKNIEEAIKVQNEQK